MKMPVKPNYPMRDVIETKTMDVSLDMLKALQPHDNDVVFCSLAATAALVFVQIKDKAVRLEEFDRWSRDLRSTIAEES